jgi:hypothetical protein
VRILFWRPRRSHTLVRNNVYRVEIETRGGPVKGLWFRPLISRQEFPGVEWSYGRGTTLVITAILDPRLEGGARYEALDKIVKPYARLRLYRNGLLTSSVRVRKIKFEYAMHRLTIEGDSDV